MRTALLAAWPFAAFALIMGVAILGDRLREPRRELRRPFAIGGERDFRAARRRVDRLAAAGDFHHAWLGCVAICTWLRGERHFGSARRQAHLSGELEVWTARRAEFNPLAEV